MPVVRTAPRTRHAVTVRRVTGTPDLRVSVIVPARNAGGDIDGLLSALAAQTFPREHFEVVFADDGSTDGSLDAADSRGLFIRIVDAGGRGAYGARNLAVAASAGEILAFCVADCRPDPQWL